MVEEFIKTKIDQYMTQFGQSESVELMKTLSGSKLFSENLAIAVNRFDIPSGKTISNIIHGCSYKFLLANKRKIYFGSLFFLATLCEKYRQKGLDADELGLSKSLMEICEIYAGR